MRSWVVSSMTSELSSSSAAIWYASPRGSIGVRAAAASAARSIASMRAAAASLQV